VRNQRIESVETIVLHHSVSKTSTTAATIREWHHGTVAYHFVVRTAQGNPRKAIVERGRPLDTVPAAQWGRNTHSWAICICGDNTKPAQAWRTSQTIATADLLDTLMLIRGKRLPVKGHREIAHPSHPTLCPAIALSSVPELRRFTR
jgi:hypothetical protein